MKCGGKMKKNNIKKLIILLFWLAVWTLTALWTDNQILMVTPWQAAVRLWELLAERTFYISVGRSLLRIAAGFFAGFTAAVLLAGVAARFPAAGDVLSPFMHFLKSVPVASFVVLLLIWWGSSFLSVAVCFLVVLPNLYINTLEGLNHTDKKLLEMARVFRLPLKNRFFYIYRPALKPFLYSGMKISLGLCWKSGVAAEVIGIPDLSIGERLYLSKIYLDTSGVFAWTAVIILLSVCFEKAVLGLTDRFFAWQPACGKPQTGKGKSGERDCKAAITIRGLYKSFDGRQVLSGVDAVFPSGSVS
jgi:NitT/TauT family transport system permease protein